MNESGRHSTQPMKTIENRNCAFPAWLVMEQQCRTNIMMQGVCLRSYLCQPRSNGDAEDATGGHPLGIDQVLIAKGHTVSRGMHPSI
jgi:hypothetical protein